MLTLNISEKELNQILEDNKNKAENNEKNFMNALKALLKGF
tara:strand:+ start:211 stop:333 length:123 start_codon:yes stop_codon:yes gene_type:complete